MEIWLRLELEDEEPIPNPGFVRQGNAVRDGNGVLADPVRNGLILSLIHI